MNPRFNLFSIRYYKFKLFQNGFTILLLILNISGCSLKSNGTNGSDSTTIQQIKPQVASGKYSFIVIKVEGNTFGYEISDNGKLLVRQKTIPALSGNRGFSSQEDAEKCANFVISKLKRNIMPPTVTPREIDSLGLLHDATIN